MKYADRKRKKKLEAYMADFNNPIGRIWGPMLFAIENARKPVKSQPKPDFRKQIFGATK